VLLVIIVIAFVLQKTLLPHVINEGYLALSLEGLKHGFVWQLVTFQFLHGGFLHLLLNCWALYVFGREVEWALGKVRFVTLYFSSGVVGGLLQMLVSLLWPGYFFSNFLHTVVGASAGVLGVVAAFAMLFPERVLTLLLFFVIPVNIRAKYLLWMSLVLAALGIAFPNSPFGGNIAHAAHLGGILTGLAFIRLREEMQYRSRAWPPFNLHRATRLVRKTPVLKVHGGPGSKTDSPGEIPSEEFISREVDPILDKISAHGIQSLTERERRILEAARNRMAKR
jgi:membrane associated rhomboid family serine protease